MLAAARSVVRWCVPRDAAGWGEPRWEARSVEQSNVMSECHAGGGKLWGLVLRPTASPAAVLPMQRGIGSAAASVLWCKWQGRAKAL